MQYLYMAHLVARNSKVQLNFVEIMPSRIHSSVKLEFWSTDYEIPQYLRSKGLQIPV